MVHRAATDNSYVTALVAVDNMVDAEAETVAVAVTTASVQTKIEKKLYPNPFSIINLCNLA